MGDSEAQHFRGLNLYKNSYKQQCGLLAYCGDLREYHVGLTLYMSLCEPQFITYYHLLFPTDKKV